MWFSSESQVSYVMEKQCQRTEEVSAGGRLVHESLETEEGTFTLAYLATSDHYTTVQVAPTILN